MKLIEQYMNDPKYWAHTKTKKKEETLGEHSRLCMAYYAQYCRIKGIDSIVKELIAACGCQDVEKVYQMFTDAIYQHDIGKINPAYQRRVLHNNNFPETDKSRNHALLSAYIYMCEQLNVLTKSERKLYSYFLFAFGYNIACHHGYLGDNEGFKDKLHYCPEREGCYEPILDLNKNSILTSDRGYDKLRTCVSDETAFYILNKLLFSLITTCDYCATAEYMGNEAVSISVIDQLPEWIERYRGGDLYSAVQEYRRNSTVFAGDINEQRCKIFLESEENILKNPNANLYYLEAPTGSGKTNMSINLFLTLLEKNPECNNVFYIFPFNTLVEQTADELSKYFKHGQDMVVINSVTPIYCEPKSKPGERSLDKRSDDTGEWDYDNAVLNRSFNNYPLVITSHVNFFQSLFGTNREACFPLIKLCRSVVIVDEIQSYRNSIWRQIILFLVKYAQLLQMKIIIMSATLPKLDILLDTPSASIVELIQNPQVYYQNPLFKKRVELDFSLLSEKPIDLKILREKVLAYKHQKVLVEFITKTAAREFFQMISAEALVYCVELSGDDNARKRKDILAQIKEKSSIIVVATQVIEAGVNIDMDIGFKDTSLPDAEEQFLGRINRSCLRSGCKVYFFNYNDAKAIYRDDERVNYPVSDPSIGAMLVDKDFKGIYAHILQDIKQRSKQKNNHNIQHTYANCLELKYRQIEKRMALIEPSRQIFLAYKLPLADGTVLDGAQIWQQYKDLCRDKEMAYGRKRVELSLMAADISCFTYTIYPSGQQAIFCDEDFGGYYYIANGEDFIDNGKFNRIAFQKATKGMFL